MGGYGTGGYGVGGYGVGEYSSFPYIQCMFIYNPGSGIVEFVPTYPAISRAALGGGGAATRHDSLTSTGIKKSVLERIDTLNTLTFPFAPAGDMANWQAFMNYALAGGVFAYRPNALDNTVWYEYTLDSMDWVPKLTSWQNHSFDIQCRLWVGATEISGS
jgi:hypothetical protein